MGGSWGEGAGLRVSKTAGFGTAGCREIEVGFRSGARATRGQVFRRGGAVAGPALKLPEAFRGVLSRQVYCGLFARNEQESWPRG